MLKKNPTSELPIEYSLKRQALSVIQLCDERIATWNKCYGDFFGKGNCYIFTVKAIRDYLDAYLNNKLSNVMLNTGYYGAYSDKVVIWDFSKLNDGDLLSASDLDRASIIVNLSFLLSNSDFTIKAFDELGVKEATPNPSRIFKHYLDGMILQYHHRWASYFSKNQQTGKLACDDLSSKVKDTTKNMALIASGALLALNGKSISLYSLLLASGALYEASGVISDKLALTFFAKKYGECNLSLDVDVDDDHTARQQPNSPLLK